MQSFHCSLCCCTVISVCFAALATKKVFCNRTLWFAVDFAKLSVSHQNLSTGKLLWSCFHWVIKQSKMLQLRFSHPPTYSFCHSSARRLYLLNCDGAASWVPVKTGRHRSAQNATCRLHRAVLRKDNENGTDFTWFICYHRKFTLLMGLCWHCRAERLIRVILDRKDKWTTRQYL